MNKTLLIIISVLLLVACRQAEKTYHDNGQVYETFYKDDEGNYHGEFKAFLEDGSLFETSTYDHGKLTGTRTIYFPSGEKEIVEQYVDGRLDGTYYSYYKSGQVELQANYVDGVMTGELTTYYPSGQVHEVVTMADNAENGPFKEYHPNGKLHWEGTYRDGDNEVGLVKEYDTTGVLIRKMQCDDRSVCQTIWTQAEGDITPTPLEELIND